MRYNRYADYPPEWDDEPEEVDPPPGAACDGPCCGGAYPPLELPEGTPADDVWHAQRAEDRDLFLHPPDLD